jgi:ATP-dependent RNA helicase RhlE
MSDFKIFPLLDSIIEQVTLKGYTEPTPIQKASIPLLLKGHDLLGIAQTGTGKTAAFSLHMIDRFGRNKINIRPKCTRALILTPTRELASQIMENIDYYAHGIGLKTQVVYGGVGRQQQVDAINSGLDILVATPGRLLDIVIAGEIDLSELEIFVLDEADTMMDLGFFRIVEKITKELPDDRQTLLFSATMPNEIAELSSDILNYPKRVEVTPQSSTTKLINQKKYLLIKANKMPLLLHILENPDYKSVLVFSKTKKGSDIIANNLIEAGITASSFHSDKHQGHREIALQDFKDEKVRVLVATDVAARGIDVNNISLVVNYNLPDDPRNYVHRIGRTARAGKSGVAISFIVPNDIELLDSIERGMDKRIEVELDHPFHKEFNLKFRKPKDKKKKKNGRRKG